MRRSYRELCLFSLSLLMFHCSSSTTPATNDDSNLSTGTTVPTAANSPTGTDNGSSTVGGAIAAPGPLEPADPSLGASGNGSEPPEMMTGPGSSGIVTSEPPDSGDDGTSGTGSEVGSGGASGSAGSGGTAGSTPTGTGGGGAAGASVGAGGGLGVGGETNGAGGAGAGGTSSGSGETAASMSEGCGKTPTITTGNGKTIDVGGTTRRYNINIPADYDSNRPYRLILGYHGASLSADIVTNESYYGLLPLSEGSTIFVAPQGLPTGGPFGDGWSNANGADVEFTRQLVDQLESDLCIDSSRVFAEGFSMGGSMAYALACAAGDLVRAVAVHSGGPMSGCVAHETPVAYFMTHGTVDGLCTYPEYGVPELQDFAGVNGCASPDPTAGGAGFEAELPNPTNSDSACIDFQGCMDGYPVRSCLFVGDHLWNPGGRSSWVPAEVWEFFVQF